MYRLLPVLKDTYITNKIISGQRAESANVGQAGTLDLFKLYDETYLSGTTNPVELSRILVQFDYSPLQELTASVLDITTGSFQALINLRDVYGGQTVPSNFTLELLPLSKSFDEGRGHDVVAFRDVDSANWLTASMSPLVTWSQGGASATGSLGEDVDVILSGTLGTPTVVGFGVTQTFARGDEELLMDVTQLVSASMVGLLPNNGFRISFVATEEQDTITRFVKRFGGHNAFNKTLHPKLIVKYGGDVITDPGSAPLFDTTQNLYVYNSVNGVYQNFFSGSTELVGTDILNLELISSKSIKVSVTQWSPSHSASITFLSNSIAYVSRSFTGGQISFGNLAQTGIYSASVNLSLVTDTDLRDFVDGRNEVEFEANWRSSDNTVLLAKNYLNFQKIQGNFSNITNKNLIINMTNLQETYSKSEVVRLRVFATDIDQDIPAFKIPTVLRSVTIPDMRWQLRNAYTRDIIIPFDSSTKMSTDQDGMYFDFFFNDLDVNQVYEFEFLIRNNIGRDNTVTNQGFRFKVVP